MLSSEEFETYVTDFSPGGHYLQQGKRSSFSYFTGVTDNVVHHELTFRGNPPVWRGRLSLQRCAYTQLTEGGPIPPVDP